MKLTRILAQLMAAAVLVAGASQSAQADEKVAFAYLKTTSMVPIFYADKKGYFKAEGVDMELIPVQGGPAVAAAVASGTAQIGYAAPTPIIIARDQGQPYKFIFGLQWERTPDQLWGPLIASQRSGIKNFKDVAGKTILTGPPGGLCELAWRDWLAKNNVAWSSVKVLTNPFPQHQAMLELGNADASCTPDPFYTSIKDSSVKPMLLGMGYLAQEKRRYIIDGVFATDTWIAANAKTIAEIKRAVAKATRELNGNKAIIRKILVDDFRLPPAVADTMKSDFNPDLQLDAAQLAPVVDAMKRYGMIKPGFNTADVVADVK
jgi:ABC-type nitrate/sulfonate/bicarbonate transport system substrate-binding protein